MNHSKISLRPPKANVGKRLSAFSTVNEVVKSQPMKKSDRDAVIIHT